MRTCYKSFVHAAPAFLLVSLTFVSVGSADPFTVQGTASMDVALTDNVSTSEFGAGRGDVFFTLRPGLVLSYTLPRMVQELGAELDLTYAAQTNQPTAAVRGGWRALVVTGPRSELTVQVNGSRTVLSALTAATMPNETVAMLQPAGVVDVTQVDLVETGSYTATREIRLAESLFARGSLTDDNATPATTTTSGEAGLSLSFDRTFQKSTLSLELGGSVLRLERDAPAGAAMGSRLDRQVNPRGRVQWRRDYTAAWSSSLDAGVVVVIPYGTDPDNPTAEHKVGAFPIFGGQLSYTDTWGVSTLSVRRDVTPNLLVAANTITTGAALAAAIPLYWVDDAHRRQPRLAAVGSLGIGRTQLITEGATATESSFIVGRADVGLVYSWRPGITYTARYELVYQSSGSDPISMMEVPGFVRNTIFLSVAVRYPAQVEAHVPTHRPIRSDGSDLRPTGVEPVVPDLVQGQ